MSPFEYSVVVATTFKVYTVDVTSIFGILNVTVSRFQVVISTKVFPVVAVKLLVPSEIVAPTGISCISSANDSEPSVSTKADDIVNGTSTPSSVTISAILL